MSEMTCGCERCHETRECTFYGRTSEPDSDAAQNGEWLCVDCATARLDELDEAVATMQAALDAPPSAREVRLGAEFDQLRAKCRDNPDAREAAIAVLMGYGNTREEAEEWIDRID